VWLGRADLLACVCGGEASAGGVPAEIHAPIFAAATSLPTSRRY